MRVRCIDANRKLKKSTKIRANIDNVEFIIIACTKQERKLVFLCVSLWIIIGFGGKFFLFDFWLTLVKGKVHRIGKQKMKCSVPVQKI